MTENEFMHQQQAAVERMKEMNARANSFKNVGQKMPPVPSFIKINQTDLNTPQNTTLPKRENTVAISHNHTANKFNIPFLDTLLKDSDSTLIIGLMLILLSENTDKMLLFALVYILL